jgi:hypothetical protein
MGGLVWFVAVPGLGHSQGERADGSVKGAVFQSVGVAVASFAALIQTCFEVGAVLYEHGDVDDPLGDLRQPIGESVFKKIDSVFSRRSISIVSGHCWCCVWFEHLQLLALVGSLQSPLSHNGFD